MGIKWSILFYIIAVVEFGAFTQWGPDIIGIIPTILVDLVIGSVVGGVASFLKWDK